MPVRAGSARRSRAGFISALLLPTLTITLLAPVIMAGPAVAASATVTGTVFNDYNNDGDQDAAGTNLLAEPGVAGASVWAYDANGTQFGPATTNASGAYSLSVPTAVSGALRIELGLPAGYESSRTGTGHSTTIRFITFASGATVTGQHFGIQHPGDYCQTNPTVCVPLFPGATVTTGTGILSFPYSAVETRATTTPVPTVVSAGTAVGPVYGLAHDPVLGDLYSASFLHRKSPFKDIDATAGVNESTAVIFKGATVYADLNALFPANMPGGANPHIFASVSNWLDDSATPTLIGKRGLGDLDITHDGRYLYTVGLNDKALYKIPTTATPTSGNVGRYPIDLSLISDAACPDADVRPFALGISPDDRILVGGICSAETSQNGNDLKYYIWEFNPTTTAFTLVTTLDVDTSLIMRKGNYAGAPMIARWLPWGWDPQWANFPRNTSAARGWEVHPMPMFTDIEFVGDDLVLGIRDRYADQVPGYNSTVAPTITGNAGDDPWAHGQGDILRVCLVSGVYTMEGNGVSGCNSGADGEWFADDQASDTWNESGTGGLASLAFKPGILTSEYDPRGYTVGGATTDAIFDELGAANLNKTATADGAAHIGGYRLYADGTAQSNLWAKTNGIGDLEALCDAAPLEIGNRVWNDTDGDGIQDAGESGIDAVTVRLYDSTGTTLLGTAVTSGGGQYYFRTGTGEAAAGNGDNIGGGLSFRTAFVIRVGIAANYSSGPLLGLSLTTSNATLGSEAYTGQSDLIDSDPVAGVGVLGTAWFPEMSVASADMNPGENDHGFDVGFVPPAARDLALRKTITSATSPLAGGTVTFQIEIFNQGTESVNGITVTDYITTAHFDALSSAPASGTTGGSQALPYSWSISGGGASGSTPKVTITGVLPAGQSVTVPLTLTVASGAPMTGLNNHAEISVFDTDGNSANGDTSTGAVFDTDSKPDATSTGDLLKDDVINEAAWVNTTGSSTGPSATLDEDDHDIATLPIFDLALIKVRAAGQAAYITSAPPSTITFDITVKNQGQTDSFLIHVQDYVGTGLTVGTNTTQVVTSNLANSRTITYAGAGEFVVDRLNAGESVTFQVITTAAAATQSTLVNTAEVTRFDNDSNAGNSLPAWVVDYDSVPDTNSLNDAISMVGIIFGIDSHNSIDNAPINGVNAADEDDHDSEGVSFALMRLGSSVYIDGNGNIVGDGTGEGVQGVLVQLRNSSGTVIAEDVTDVYGDYWFTGLYPGTYTVGIPAVQDAIDNSLDASIVAGALSGYEPVPGAVTNPESLNFDNDGDAESGWLSMSDNVVLTYGSEPADEAGDKVRADTAIGTYPAGASNLNIDFVFQVKTYEVGNIVWLDANDDGIWQAAEDVIENVDVELWLDVDGDGVFEPSGDDSTGFVGTETTDADGHYWFSDLLAGLYFVHIDSGQTALIGLGTGTSPDASANNDEDNDNNGVADGTNGGWTSGQFELGEGTGDEEPTGELDAGVTSAEDGTPADNRANQTIDFAFVERMRIGNQVWRDESDSNPATEAATDNNGVFNAGSGEVGIAGVTVRLYTDDGDGVFEPGTGDTLAATAVTDAEGNYWFDDVAVNRDYFVGIQTVPSGFTTPRSSGGQSATPSTADNDDDGAASAGWVSVSEVFTATPNAAPTGELDVVPAEDAEVEANANTQVRADNDSNLRVDFGFVDVPLYRVGNLVWFDADNDGIADSSEAGLEGVLVQLLNSSGTVIAEDATDSGGHYSFQNLVAGDYSVRIPGVQVETLGGGLTLVSGVLDGLESSTTDGGDVDSDVDDNDDNGIASGIDWVTGLITLGASFDSPFGTEPVNEVLRSGSVTDDDTGWASGPDNRSNFTADFGFHELLRIGDTVWLDNGGSPYTASDEDDGQYDATESPISGVDVNLYVDDGDGVFEPGVGAGLDGAPVATTTTDVAGEYFFTGLDEGDYWVAIPDAQTEMLGLRSSTGQAANDSVNDRDQGAPATGFDAVSRLVVMRNGVMSNGDSADEANADTKTSTTVSDVNSNLAIDFGFSPVPEYALGNLVWEDLDNDGVADSGEFGIAGVEVFLYLDTNGNGTLEPGLGIGLDGPPVATDTSDGSGLYSFEGLPAGDYLVHIAGSELPNHVTSGTPDASANNDEDNDNNGVVDGANGGWTSGPVTLGEGSDHDEPTGEMDGTTGADAEASITVRDDRSNQTVDFGFWPGLRIGNLVWHDESDANLSTTAAGDNNGLVDAGEVLMPGVTVALFLDGGDGVFDAGLGFLGDDTLVGTTVSSAEGNYWFEHLAAGSYFVAVESLPGSYGDMQSSDGRNSGGAAADNNDNGELAYDGAIIPSAYLSVSDLITLAAGSEPTAEADGIPAADGSAESEANAALSIARDSDSELTVDLGFILTPLYRVGNLVWSDTDRDGIADPGELGIQGVLVQLIDDGGSVIAEDVTDVNGKYDFDDLAAGDYSVRIPGVQDAIDNSLDASIVAAALVNMASTIDAGDPDTDVDDNDDNGVVSGISWESEQFTLGAASGPYGTEPTSETLRSGDVTDDDSGWANGTDAHSEFTVDFGFVAVAYEVGNVVWIDANDDGIWQGAEDVIENVDVELWLDVDGDGVFEPAGDDSSGYVGTETTDADGHYWFSGLMADVYFLHIDSGQTALIGLGTGTSPDASANNDEDNDNNGVSDGTNGGWTSGQFELGEGAGASEPTGEVDATLVSAEDGTPADALANQTIDFAFIESMRIGNQVWRDESDSNPATEAATDNNGIFNAGSGEVGIAGVTVRLYTDDGDGVFEPGTGDTLAATTVTDAEGNYWFDDVVVDEDYFVAIQSVPAGFTTPRSSGGQSATPSTADNDDDGAASAGWVSVSEVFTATPNAAPTGELDVVPAEDAELEANAAGGAYNDNDSNLRVDFGFVDVPLYRLGNLVWLDLNNDGIADATEDGIEGVLVQLVDDTDTVIGETVTDANGSYAFENLVAGDYRVRIPGNQTEVLGGGLTIIAGALEALESSTNDAGDPDTDVDDNDDNGLVSGINWQSQLVTLGASFDSPFGTEPINEVLRSGGDDDSGWVNGPDNRSNFTVDFGFYPQMRIGDTVWLDNGGTPYVLANEDDGEYDANEAPISGVDVSLYEDDGDGVFEPGADDGAPIDTTTTDVDGEYFFTGLDGGEYWVAIPNAQTELLGLRSSTGQAANDSVNDRDQGDPETGFSAVSNVISLTPETMSNGDSGDEANADTKTGVTIADANSDLAIDFGFVPAAVYAIGNLAWKDLDNDGIADAGEQGFAGLTVNLYLDNGDNVFTLAGEGAPIASTVTGLDGRYLFENLEAGTYFVMIPYQASLDGWVTSGTPDANANNDEDNDNNGVLDAWDGSLSGPVVLGNGNDHEEPTGETDGTTGADAEAPVAIRDDRSNQTVDFGYWPGLRLGNLVWHDESDSDLSTTAAGDNNGVVNAGEAVMPGVTVALYQDGGDATFDGGFGDDTLVGTTTTDAEGNYWFDHLPAGDYFVAIETLPGAFGVMESSDGRNAGGAAADNNDNGEPGVDGASTPYLSISDLITLAAGTEPAAESDGIPGADGSAELEADSATEPFRDTDSELTIDLGFILTPEYRVGNLVWRDSNRDGIAQTGEPGIEGVLVQLLDDSAVVIAETVTDASGKYAFDGLAAGDYRVRIPGSQTELLGGGLTIIAGALDNLASTTDAGDPDTDVDDNDDNGVIAGSDWQSAVFTLGASSGPHGTEPTTETLRFDDASDDDSGWVNGTDAHSEFTVDFGFYPGLRLGDTVWLDDGDASGAYVPANEDNGIYDAAESPLAGVDVWLYLDGGTLGVFEPGAGDVVIATTETDVDGEYFFIGLDEGVDYWVAIPDAATQDGSELDGLRSSTGQSADGLGTNDHDHGAPATGFLAVSPLVDLTRGGMAYGDSADEANADTKTGVTLDDGDSNLVEDFGFSPVPTYEIGNLVWLDNDNGIAETGETGIPGITVYLFRNSGSAAFEPGGGEEDGLAIASTTTGADGRYTFTGLPAGDYWVFIPEQSGLEGLASSLVRETNAGNDVDNDNNAIEFSYLASTGWAASLVTVGEGNDHQEPTFEEDGTTSLTAEDGAPRDDRANQTVDFGFSERIRLGNQVWLDESDGNPATTVATDNNGIFDAGSGEVGIANVTVELWRDIDGDGFEAGDDDVLIDSSTTDGEGNYLFVGIVPNVNYYVAVQNVGVPLTDARSSAGQSATPSTADNDDDGAPQAGYLAVSEALALAAGAQPTGENDAVPAEDAEAEANSASESYADDNSNLEVDFGFIEVPLYRIGNLVWLDLDNDGIAEASEQGISGVWVQLLNGAGTVIDEAVTDSGGHYAFENLAAGDYRIVIPTDQSLYSGSDLAFDLNALDHLASSTTDVANANGDVDNDENGIETGTDWRSGFVTLGAGPDAAIGTEPTNELLRSGSATDDDSGWAAGPDNRSNVTVDFGFYQLLRLGNWVWLDDGGVPYVLADEDDGEWDANETGLASVNLNLYLDDGDGVFEPSTDDVLTAATSTDSHGHYYFTDLVEGDYWVAIPGSQAPLSGLRSSTGQAVSDTTDNRDQGEPALTFASVSNLVTLTAGGTAVGEGSWETGADVETGFVVADASSHLTIDFGFSPIPEYALGNLVWEDYDNDGVADSGEPGIPGLTVELFADDGDGVLDAGDGVAIATDTTDADGRYLFEGLPAGDYLIHIPDGQAEIADWYVAGTPVATANNDVDNDNNAVPDGSNGGFTAGAVTLGEGSDHDEPSGEADGTTGDDAEIPVSVRDDRSNQTVDFGFWRGLRLGNQVWLDEGAGANDNNGVYDDDEAPIAGVPVVLWIDGGDATFDGGSGDDIYVSNAVTDTDGHYYFEHLAEGSYWVTIPSIPGDGVLSSTNTTGPSLSLDGEDDGAPNAGSLSVSPLYSLSVGNAPIGELDGPGVTTDDAEAAADAVTGDYRDEDSYLTVDFGFINVPLYRVGNLVWHDLVFNGDAEAGEPGIEGVLVQLFTTADVLVDETVTDVNGTYAFSNLAGGDYYVRIPAVQDAVNNSLDASIVPSALDGLYPTVWNSGTPNDDLDNDSNLGASTWLTGSITLGGSDPDSEPTNETLRLDDATDDDSGQGSVPGPRIDDDRSNYTVDAGFYSFSIGNHVWEDANNNGLYEPGIGELGIDGVTVTLWQVNGGGDIEMESQVTSGGGLYLFLGMVYGEQYYVSVDASNFESGGALEGLTSSTGSQGAIVVGSTDELDRGIDPATPYGAVLSLPMSYGAGLGVIDGDAPFPDNDSVRTDDNENLVVDFGFYRLELGGNVFWDPTNDGQDDADGDFANVTVLLYNGDGTPFLREDGSQASTTTDVNGDYLFTGLPEGSYIVEIPASNFPAGQALQDLGSSDGNDVTPDVAPLADNDMTGEDNGNPSSGNVFDGSAVRSSVVNLVTDDEPTASDTAPSAGTPDSNSNRSVDFGFWIVQNFLELGNQIWFDEDEDGIYDRPAELPAPAGVQIELWNADSNTIIGVTFTDADGRYLFPGLPSGRYFLVLAASNFDAGGPLYGYVATSGAGVSEAPDDGIDSDSNGLHDGPVVRTPVIDFVSSMPVLEDDGFVTVLDDRLSDLTLDIGLIDIVLAETGANIDLALRTMLWFLALGILLLLAARRLRREEP